MKDNAGFIDNIDFINADQGGGGGSSILDVYEVGSLGDVLYWDNWAYQYQNAGKVNPVTAAGQTVYSMDGPRADADFQAGSASYTYESAVGFTVPPDTSTYFLTLGGGRTLDFGANTLSYGAKVNFTDQGTDRWLVQFGVGRGLLLDTGSTRQQLDWDAGTVTHSSSTISDLYDGGEHYVFLELVNGTGLTIEWDDVSVLSATVAALPNTTSNYPIWGAVAGASLDNRYRSAWKLGLGLSASEKALFKSGIMGA